MPGDLNLQDALGDTLKGTALSGFNLLLDSLLQGSGLKPTMPEAPSYWNMVTGQQGAPVNDPNKVIAPGALFQPGVTAASIAGGKQAQQLFAQGHKVLYYDPQTRLLTATKVPGAVEIINPKLAEAGQEYGLPYTLNDIKGYGEQAVSDKYQSDVEAYNRGKDQYGNLNQVAGQAVAEIDKVNQIRSDEMGLIYQENAQLRAEQDLQFHNALTDIQGYQEQATKNFISTRDKINSEIDRARSDASNAVLDQISYQDKLMADQISSFTAEFRSMFDEMRTANDQEIAAIKDRSANVIQGTAGAIWENIKSGSQAMKNSREFQELSGDQQALALFQNQMAGASSLGAVVGQAMDTQNKLITETTQVYRQAENSFRQSFVTSLGTMRTSLSGTAMAEVGATRRAGMAETGAMIRSGLSDLTSLTNSENAGLRETGYQLAQTRSQWATLRGQTSRDFITAVQNTNVTYHNSKANAMTLAMQGSINAFQMSQQLIIPSKAAGMFELAQNLMGFGLGIMSTDQQNRMNEYALENAEFSANMNPLVQAMETALAYDPYENAPDPSEAAWISGGLGVVGSVAGAAVGGA